MKRLLIIALILICCSCTQKGCARMEKSMQYSERQYSIYQYSGGKLIGEYHFRGILNDAEGSDGYYWFKGDSLIEVSGDLTIKSVDL